MRTRNLFIFVALAALFCVIFSVAHVTAARKTAGLDGRVRSLDASKAVPNQLNYQGFLVDATDSAAVTDTLEMTFRLYDAVSGGTELWSETHPAVEVNNGLFYVLLGSITPFSAGLFGGSPMWLQTEVSAEVLAPRKPLVSVAYGMRAQEADHAIYADTAAYTQVAGMTAADSAAVADDAHQLEGQNLADLDARYMNEVDLDHLNAADGTPANAVYVDTAGNVGVGTTSPAAKLDVDGDVNADSVYKIEGNTVFSISGVENTLVGIGAGVDNTGIFSTFVGDSAGYKNQGPGNTFLGTEAGYSNTTANLNTFVGRQAGYLNTTGAQNTFLGSGSGYSNTTGGGNTFSGYSAGRSNSTGSRNIFIGFEAGQFNTEGSENTFIGWKAGSNNTTSSANTFVGFRAGYNNTIGYYNTFLGPYAGQYNTEGQQNTFVGGDAGISNTTGNYNAFLGDQAGSSNTTGERNTYVGSGAGISNSTGNGNVFIGYVAGWYETGSNKLYIANGIDTSDVVIYGDFSTGNVGLGTLSPARRLHVSDVMRLEPRDSAPGSPSEGDMYMDKTTHKLMVYDGSDWQACW